MKNCYCVLDKNKLCDDCGECDICDLNPDKKCDNCGKCLEMKDYDMKAVKVDDIIDDEDEFRTYEKDEEEYCLNDFHSHLADGKGNDSNSEEDSNVEFIDDIDGLKEALENEEIFKKVAYEEYPGLIRIQKKHEDK